MLQDPGQDELVDEGVLLLVLLLEVVELLQLPLRFSDARQLNLDIEESLLLLLLLHLDLELAPATLRPHLQNIEA